jgi:hypothetical protein
MRRRTAAPRPDFYLKLLQVFFIGHGRTALIVRCWARSGRAEVRIQCLLTGADALGYAGQPKWGGAGAAATLPYDAGEDGRGLGHVTEVILCDI